VLTSVTLAYRPDVHSFERQWVKTARTARSGATQLRTVSEFSLSLAVCLLVNHTISLCLIISFVNER
jgi:hypothetical protein